MHNVPEREKNQGTRPFFIQSFYLEGCASFSFRDFIWRDKYRFIKNIGDDCAEMFWRGIPPLYACTHTYTFTHIRICLHMHIHIHKTHTCVHTPLEACTHTCTYAHKHLHAHAHTHTQYPHMRTHTYTNIRMYASTHIHNRVHIHIRLHAYIHRPIHIYNDGGQMREHKCTNIHESAGPLHTTYTYTHKNHT